MLKMPKSSKCCSLGNYCREDTSAVKKGFAKAYESHSDALKPKEEPQDTESFASLLRNSKFIDLGDPRAKLCPAKSFMFVGDDLYIDFG
ncbi:hypothetical protein DOY81_008563 [Sarcophaga bullata]|nr:hypothetical protein DOY81_008563 [Sarcophaga bullata]